MTWTFPKKKNVVLLCLSYSCLTKCMEVHISSVWTLLIHLAFFVYMFIGNSVIVSSAAFSGNKMV